MRHRLTHLYRVASAAEGLALSELCSEKASARWRKDTQNGMRAISRLLRCEYLCAISLCASWASSTNHPLGLHSGLRQCLACGDPLVMSRPRRRAHPLSSFLMRTSSRQTPPVCTFVGLAQHEGHVVDGLGGHRRRPPLIMHDVQRRCQQKRSSDVRPSVVLH